MFCFQRSKNIFWVGTFRVGSIGWQQRNYFLSPDLLDPLYHLENINTRLFLIQTVEALLWLSNILLHHFKFFFWWGYNFNWCSLSWLFLKIVLIAFVKTHTLYQLSEKFGFTYCLVLAVVASIFFYVWTIYPNC